MKTEFERISEIMYTLLEHQPVIDVPYEKINDIAVALVKEGYGDVSEYKAEIERLKAENGQSRKLGILGNNATVEFLDDTVSEPSVECKDIEKYAKQFRNRIISINEKEIKQAKIDVLNKVKDIVFDYLGVKNIKEAEALSLLDSTLTYDVVTCGIDELIKEVQDE